MRHISTIAVPLSGNKGSVSMLLSIVQNFTKQFHDIHFDVFTYYPKHDLQNNAYSNVSIHSGTPLNLLLHLVPVSFLYFVCKKLHISLPKSILGKEITTLLKSDLYLAVGGTTFSDAKLLKVVFNILCLLPAKFLGLKLVLYTQTMGPFRNPFNRIMARWVLSSAEIIIARGLGSYEHLNTLKLSVPKVDWATDGAFSLENDIVQQNIINTYAPMFQDKTVVGISPNSIVAAYCQKYRIDHAKIYGDFINYLIEKGYFPVLIPHSMKTYSRNRHNNDLPIIEEVLEHVTRREALLFVREDYSYLELRSLIGMTDYYIASRFHSMISALYMKCPVLVFGWGYQKYLEVMDEFDLAEYVFDVQDITLESLIGGFEKMVQERNKIVQKIEKSLPEVIENSRKAIALIKPLLQNND